MWGEDARECYPLFWRQQFLQKMSVVYICMPSVGKFTIEQNVKNNRQSGWDSVPFPGIMKASPKLFSRWRIYKVVVFTGATTDRDFIPGFILNCRRSFYKFWRENENKNLDLQKFSMINMTIVNEILSPIYWRAKRQTALLKTRKRRADDEQVGPELRLQPCWSLKC